MTRQELFSYVKKQYHTEPDYPWEDENAVLRHKESRKWYGVVLQVAWEKLGVAKEGMAEILNVKCDPVLIGSLRQRDGFFPAYHMNKDQWISILLGEAKLDSDVKQLVDLSYEMTRGKKQKYNNNRKEQART